METIWILLALLALWVIYYNRDMFIKQEVKVEPKVYEPTFILENEGKSRLCKLIDYSVDWTINHLKQTWFDCDKTNIWTNQIHTFQLQCKLERMVKLNYTLSEEEGKEMVRKIIKMYHLRTVEKYPELKEY